MIMQRWQTVMLYGSGALLVWIALDSGSLHLGRWIGDTRTIHAQQVAPQAAKTGIKVLDNDKAVVEIDPASMKYGIIRGLKQDTTLDISSKPGDILQQIELQIDADQIRQLTWTGPVASSFRWKLPTHTLEGRDEHGQPFKLAVLLEYDSARQTWAVKATNGPQPLPPAPETTTPRR